MERKTALITGASRGIGKKISELLAKNNINVIVNYFLHQKEAEKIVDEINSFDMGKSIAIKADVANVSEVKKMVEKSVDVFGNIDILINNAGISQQKMFTDISEDDWNRMFDVNVKGMYNCIKYLLPGMIKNKSGKIVNISSIWGISGASCEVHYSASKAAVIGLTKALAKEVGPCNIQVNCVAPGVIKTDMLNEFNEQDIKDLKDKTPLGVVGVPEDIAKTVYFLVSGDADFITGQVISPNGGFVI